MNFQACTDNIKAKTGKTPLQTIAAMEKAGVLAFDMKAKVFCDRLASEYGLGHGHAMALWAVAKSKGQVPAPKKR